MKKHDTGVMCGETFSHTLYFTGADGSVIDLTGRTACCQIRETPESAGLIAEMTCTVNPQTGSINLYLSAADTAAILPGRYVYDFKTVDISGFARFYLGGFFDVLPSVTR